jgi:predicted nuclease of predicted toxin-antitoxin system
MSMRERVGGPSLLGLRLQEVAALPDSFTRDPADRVIVATTRVHNASLLTRDSGIVQSQLVPNRRVSDLRRADYPGWEVTRSLDDILRELAAPTGG